MMFNIKGGRKMRRKGLVAMLAIVLLLAFGCAGSQFPSSPRGNYAAALTFYNNAIEAYYNALVLQPPDVRTEWKAKINPKLNLAGDALALWGSAVGTPDGEAKEVAYLRLLQQLMIVLVDCDVIEIGG
jgi:hypothetical protein